MRKTADVSIWCSPKSPDSGKDELKGSVPMVTSSLKKGGYEEDINLW